MLRRGVSLMEVLVSIGVVSIGLMGVAALIPLAFHEAETGARSDRKALVSKRAYREFHLLGMANPAQWVNLRTLGSIPNPSGSVDTQSSPRVAYCLDPRWVANNADQATVPWWYSLPAVSASLTAPQIEELSLRVPLMERISLRPAPDASTWMSLPHADEIFLAQDDLEFELPKQQALPPVQTPLTDATPQKYPLKRYAQGNFSWFATVVPEDGYSDMYKLSIAVCYQRNLNAVEIVAPVIAPDSQQLASATSQFGTGIGINYAGGDITVATTPNLASAHDSVLVNFNGGPIPVQVGEYVMLTRHVLTATGFTQRFQWYRVVAVDNAPDNLILSLHGADWDFKPVVVQGVTANDISRQRTYMVYVPGITSVFEKTIRLETSSLWMN